MQSQQSLIGEICSSNYYSTHGGLVRGWNNEDNLGLLTLHRVINATSRGGQTQLNLKWLREGGRTHISSGSLERKGGRWNNGDNCLQKLATFVCTVKFLEFSDGCVVIPKISATV